MSSSRALTFCAMAVWGAVALTAAPNAFSNHHHNAPIMIAAASEFPMKNCGDFHANFDRHEAVYQSEDRTITKAEAPLLTVLAEPNGGLYVEGWDQDTYSVTLCKAVEAGPDADTLFSQMHLSFNGGTLRVSMPTRNSSAHILIRAPKGSALDLQVHNGPLTLTHVDGTLKVRAENGPVTVTDCTGELNLDSRNGPVTLEGNSGKQTIHADNGPVSLRLSGSSWNGQGIQASAQNGPVTLEVPSGYQSGVVLESEGHSPFQCSASVCSEGRKTWDDDHKRVEFGSGPTVVRVSSVNGPVSVR
jgi:hypothetical protein